MPCAPHVLGFCSYDNPKVLHILNGVSGLQLLTSLVRDGGGELRHAKASARHGGARGSGSGSGSGEEEEEDKTSDLRKQWCVVRQLALWVLQHVTECGSVAAAASAQTQRRGGSIVPENIVKHLVSLLDDSACPARICFCASACAAPTLNAAGQPRVTLSLR